MIKREFKIINLRPTFLTVPLKTKSVGMPSKGESDFFPDSEITALTDRHVKKGNIRIEFKDVPASDTAKAGRVEIKKEKESKS